MLDIGIAHHVCLATRGEEEAWVWHAQFSHLHFAMLREMDRYGLVRGMPLLTQVEQVCEALKRASLVNIVAHQSLNVHWGKRQRCCSCSIATFCNSVSPSMPSGNRYFSSMTAPGICGCLCFPAWMLQAHLGGG